MKLIKLALLSFLLIAGNAYANQVINTKIKNVRVRHGVAYIKFEHCARYTRVYLDSEYAKAMYSTALTAGTSEKDVTVELDSDDCSVSESQVVYLDVKF